MNCVCDSATQYDCGMNSSFVVPDCDDDDDDDDDAESAEPDDEGEILTSLLLRLCLLCLSSVPLTSSFRPSPLLLFVVVFVLITTVLL